MEQEVVIDMIQNVFVLVLILSAPVLAVSVIVGLAVSIFQTITQIQPGRSDMKVSIVYFYKGLILAEAALEMCPRPASRKRVTFTSIF